MSVPDIETILSTKDIEIYHLRQENERLKQELLTASKIDDINMRIDSVLEAMAKMLDENEDVALAELKSCQQSFTELRRDCMKLRQDYISMHPDESAPLGRVPEPTA